MTARVLAPAAAALMLLVLLVTDAAPAAAQTPPVRLAAASDCPRNPNCIPGFRRVYGIDPTSLYTPLKVADAGVQALDDGAAEVAVAFSSNPQLSRPDILTLADDRRMISSDHVVPVVRTRLAHLYGPALRRRLDATSRLLSTLELRGLNQQVIDGRLPEAVGGEFADANGLGGPSHRRAGPVIRIGYQAFSENQTLAHLYAESLRGAGYRVRVRAIGGLRAAAVNAMRHNRIDLWPGYSGSLQGYLGGSSLRRALARIGARPAALSPAEDRNGFAMKRDTALRLGISRLSDLARYWPPAGAGKLASLAQAGAEPLLPDQWAVAPGSVLDLPDAWQLATGRGVTVAIVDTGAKIDHVDLGPNIWTNFDEVPDNGIDDDHNGYVDDVHGVDLTSATPGQDLSDGQGHGTHVAGIAAAARNGQGVVGVAPQAKLMIVKVLDAGGRGTTGSVAEGIRYAAANGARVINLSLGGDSGDQRMVDAVQAAAAANALVVCSAGNDGRDIDVTPSYPAAIPAPNLLAVASTDPEDGRGKSDYSNYGRLAVQVAAPGAQIFSSSNTGSWEYKSGTSMAAPMVTGVAALALSVNPNLSAVDLRADLMQNATRSDLPVAAGYIDALHSVLSASSAVGSGTGQPPRVGVLEASRSGRRVRVRAAVLGSTAAIARYRVTIGKRVAQLSARNSPFTLTVTLRRGARIPRRARVQALDAAGRPLTAGSRVIVRQGKGKGGVGSGPGVGT